MDMLSNGLFAGYSVLPATRSACLSRSNVRGKNLQYSYHRYYYYFTLIASPSHLRRRSAAAFTLVELLVVLAIVALLLTLALPAVSSLQKSDSLNLATASLAGIFDEARTFAMANNTYVFVGVEEIQFSPGGAGTPVAGTGRVAVQTFYSLDGTMNLASSNLRGVSRLQVFDNIHLPSSLATGSATTGTLAQRPSVPADCVVGSDSFPTASAPLTSEGYTFNEVIAFDPQGRVHLPATTPEVGMQYLEIDLQQSNGSVPVPVASAKNLSAIQIDGLTGSVTVYRS